MQCHTKTPRWFTSRTAKGRGVSRGRPRASDQAPARGRDAADPNGEVGIEVPHGEGSSLRGHHQCHTHSSASRLVDASSPF